MNAAGAGRSGWARKAGGWSLLLVGLAGCVLPVIPGIPLMLAGLLVLARDYVWARKAVRYVKRKAVAVRRRTRTKAMARGIASREAAAQREQV